VTTSLAEINVVPLVDVMLVLLIIFMVAAPMMQQGYPVQLPESSRSREAAAPITVTIPVTFRDDQRVQIDDEFVPFATLPERIRQEVIDRPDKTVLLAADGAVTTSELISVMDRLGEGGVDKVNIQTQPTTGRRR
jgi:biopolymer transport protein ExbD